MKKDNKVKIFVAVIGFIGVLITALMGNLDMFFGSETLRKTDDKNNIVINNKISINSTIPSDHKKSFTQNSLTNLGCSKAKIKFKDVKQGEKLYFWDTFSNNNSDSEVKIKGINTLFSEEIDFNKEANPKFITSNAIRKLKDIIPPLSDVIFIKTDREYIAKIPPTHLTDKGDANFVIRYKTKYQIKYLDEKNWDGEIKEKVDCTFYRIIPKQYQSEG